MLFEELLTSHLTLSLKLRLGHRLSLKRCCCLLEFNLSVSRFSLRHLVTSQFGPVYSICYVFRSGTVCALLGPDLFGLSVFVPDARSCAFSIYIFFVTAKFVENVCNCVQVLQRVRDPGNKAATKVLLVKEEKNLSLLLPNI